MGKFQTKPEILLESKRFFYEFWGSVPFFLFVAGIAWQRGVFGFA